MFGLRTLCDWPLIFFHLVSLNDRCFWCLSISNWPLLLMSLGLWLTFEFVVLVFLTYLCFWCPVFLTDRWFWCPWVSDWQLILSSLCIWLAVDFDVLYFGLTVDFDVIVSDWMLMSLCLWLTVWQSVRATVVDTRMSKSTVSEWCKDTSP